MSGLRSLAKGQRFVSGISIPTTEAVMLIITCPTEEVCLVKAESGIPD
jgi:hypothetical protein